MTAKALMSGKFKSVVGLPWGGPTPVAFVRSMPFAAVMWMLPKMKPYKPKAKSKPNRYTRHLVAPYTPIHWK